MSVENEHQKILGLLISHGANVQTQDKTGATPLHIAASKGFDNIAYVLIRNGSDVINSTDRYGKMPLHWAAENS